MGKNKELYSTLCHKLDGIRIQKKKARYMYMYNRINLLSTSNKYMVKQLY